MDHPDTCRDALESIKSEFSAFCETLGEASEADTRVKLIDRILTEVCGWPEPQLKRETHVDSGYIDYSLIVRDKPLVAVEAKRSGKSFTLPLEGNNRKYRLSGTLSTDKNTIEAINQVRNYCDDLAIRFAIATNGNAWIVFRAVRDDGIPWKSGEARVFPSLEYIHTHFTDFWNLLSFERIVAGSLNEEFSGTLRTSRNLHRIIDRLWNADVPLHRNRLNHALQPLIRLIFEDIADQEQLDILRSCYIHSASLDVITRDLYEIITELVPLFLEREGTVSVDAEHPQKNFERTLNDAIATNAGELFLLLGGIGSGKSTFLKRYQRTTGQQILHDKTLWFLVDFLKAPLEPSELETFVWQGVLNDLRSRYKDSNFESRRYVKEVFSDNIAAVNSTFLNDYKRGSHKYEEALSPYLRDWQRSLSEYVPKLLKVASMRENRASLIFIDNVDQLSSAYQAKIFLLAQRVTRLVGSITLIALREESYYTASVQRSFTAYTNRKFHIAPPHSARMITSRLEYTINVLTARNVGNEDSEPKQLDEDMRDFLAIVKGSIFGQNVNVGRFIKCLCHGDMRLALKMFTTFLCSGVTDVDKMLRIHRREGYYSIAYHEFVKSIMLGDRRFYREEQSPILNLFNVGTERNSSHFTAHRIINVLLSHTGETTAEGRGFVEINRLLSEFEEVFDNREDFIKTLNRLVGRHLVEANTRSPETVEGASYVRTTTGGWYYVRQLARTFAYLDLVLQDTPFSRYNIESDLRQAVFDVDNLIDRDSEKEAKTKVRLDRVEAFLDYLAEEEERERLSLVLDGVNGAIGERIVRRIRKDFDSERAWIERRLRENRERYEEEVQFEGYNEVEYDVLQQAFADTEVTTNEAKLGSVQGNSRTDDRKK